MIEYRGVMSIHDQKMRKYMAAAQRDRMARMARRGRVRLIDKVAQALGRRLKSAGEAILANQQRMGRLA